jgi:exodeoxyribonuclease VII large subunit
MQPNKEIWSVSELNRAARDLLEAGIPRVWIEGEVSNLARPASGHLYFSLKDRNAQIRCAFFRQRQRGSNPADLAGGAQVLAFGKVSLYEPRGDYQLIVERIEAAGEGELRRQFEALKRKLAAEGLFDEASKRALPPLPRRIGVVTSPSGAALRDILHILERRFPTIPVIIFPTAVQGAAAPGEIVRALGRAASRGDCDVIIVARGGGSLEDLWAFNDEAVARAIAEMPVPVVSGVGHETDVTIADFVADVRAPTPSGAAELAVPDRREWQVAARRLSRGLENAIGRTLHNRAQRLDFLQRRLAVQSPAVRVARQRQLLGSLERRLSISARGAISGMRQRADRLAGRLHAASPVHRLRDHRQRYGYLRRRLAPAARGVLQRHASRLALAGRALNAVSPLATLGRGYAIVMRRDSRTPVTSIAAVADGDEFAVRLADGEFDARVTGNARPNGADNSN